MNRETKRMLQRQGELGKDGEPIRTQRQPPSRAGAANRAERVSPIGFLKGVRNELRKVSWPNRDELKTFTGVVIIALVVLIPLVVALDYAFSQGATFLFK